MSTNTRALLTALITAVSATAVGVLVAAILGWGKQNETFLIALVALVVVSELAEFSPFPNSGVSMSIGVIFAAGIFGGFPVVVVVALAVALADQVLHRVALHKATYNAGLLIITGATFTATVDMLSNANTGDPLSLMAPVMLGSLIAFAVNSSLLALAISLEGGRRPWSVCGADFAWMIPHYLILAVLALFMAAAYDRWELRGLALVLAPVAMLWLVIKNYVDRLSVPGATPAQD